MKTLTKHLISAAFLASFAWTVPALSDDTNPLLDTRTLIGELTPVTGEVRFVNLHIPFKLNSAALTPEAEKQLTYLGEALQSPELSGLEVSVNGHTDASGSADYNMALSERRAQSVRDYLLGNFNLTAELLTAKGFGETRLLDSESPNAARNRRVEIVTTRPVNEEGGDVPVEGATQAIN